MFLPSIIIFFKAINASGGICQNIFFPRKYFFWVKGLQRKKSGCNVVYENSSFLKHIWTLWLDFCCKIEMILNSVWNRIFIFGNKQSA